MIEEENKISIIIPVYNVKDYIRQCVESLIQQTYQNLELILVDDGSTDQSGDICDEYAKRYPQIKVYHKTNGGVSTARNYGLQNANGDYIGFVDPDDWVEPDMFGKMFVQINEKRADAAFCGYYREEEDRSISGLGQTDRLQEVDCYEAMKQILVPDGYFTTIWNKMFRKKCLFDDQGELILFPKEYSVGEDEIWLARVISNAQKIVLMNDKYYHWRIRSVSASHVKKVEKNRLSDMEAQKKVLKILENKEAFQESIHLVKLRLFTTSFWCMHDAYMNGQMDIVKELIRENQSMDEILTKTTYVSFQRKREYNMIRSAIQLHMPSGLIRGLHKLFCLLHRNDQ